MTRDDISKPNIKRRAGVAAGIAAVASAAVGGYVAAGGGPAKVQLTAAPAAVHSAPAEAQGPDTDNLQQGNNQQGAQGGNQQGDNQQGAQGGNQQGDNQQGDNQQGDKSNQDGNFNN